jgi:hypothetical protein
MEPFIYLQSLRVLSAVCPVDGNLGPGETFATAIRKAKMKSFVFDWFI